MPESSFGEKINTHEYPKTEDAYIAVNLLVINVIVVYCMYSLRIQVRNAYIDNINNNENQREINWMMTRTLEIDGSAF